VINKMHAKIKFNSVYVCSDCSREAVGDTAEVEYLGRSTRDLKHFIDQQRPRSAEMPVGWSYDGAFHCGCRKGGI